VNFLVANDCRQPVKAIADRGGALLPGHDLQHERIDGFFHGQLRLLGFHRRQLCRRCIALFG
jgi:hypothetical protein